MEINWESQVLSSVSKVIPKLSCMEINIEKLHELAINLSQEDFGINYEGNPNIVPEEYIRKTMLINTLNFVFTDFLTSAKYKIENLSDTDAMVYQIDKALLEGAPLTQGYYMRDMNLKEFKRIFTGNIEMPMADEKVEILNNVGDTLVTKYSGDWINFIDDGPKKLYDNGEGLVERLVRDFKRFDDHSIFENEKVYFLKLAQLAFWGIHRELSKRHFYIEDMENMTAFADYIIPVALESFGIVKYSSGLKEKIDSGILIDRDSIEEIEIRSTSIYVTSKLTELINNYKNEEEKIIIPQLDFKLWTDFHADERPHHLTKTIMY
jgi:hypothetical protein